MNAPTITAAMVEAVKTAAHTEHVRDVEAEWLDAAGRAEAVADNAKLLAASDVIVQAVNAPSDLSFDRCSHAMHAEEPVYINGETYRIVRYVGSWIIELATGFGGTITKTSEDLARLLDASAAHPNPYIGSVEVTYSSRGFRALYGVRRDGTPVLWQD